MTITREHCRAVANWIEGIDPLPILKHMKYRQRAGYSETACCMMCALSLVSGRELKDREVFTRIFKTELSALGECFLIAVALWNATDQQYGPVIAALLRDDRAEAERRAVAQQQRNGSGLWLSGVVRNQTGGESRLYGAAQSHGQSGGVAVLKNDAVSIDQTDGTAWLYDSAQSRNQSGGEAWLLNSAQSHGQTGGVAWLLNSAQSHGQTGGEAGLYDNAQSHGQSGGVVRLWNSAQSHGQTGGVAKLYESAQSHGQTGGVAVLFDSAQSHDQNGGVAWLWCNAESHNMRGGTLYVRSPNAKVIDHRGGTVIWQECRGGRYVETRREEKPEMQVS